MDRHSSFLLRADRVIQRPCWYRVTLRRFTSPRGVWTPVPIEYRAGEAGR